MKHLLAGVTLATAALGASAQAPLVLLCKGDGWNQFLTEKLPAAQMQLVVTLNTAARTMRFVDVGFGELTGELKVTDDSYSAVIKAPPNPLGVKVVTANIGRITGSGSVIYFIGEGSDRSLASFAGTCERATAKF
jgi:hypothetical protein